MKKHNLSRIVALLLVVFLMWQAAPLSGQGDGGLIDDFESGNFDESWWFYDEGSTFACAPESPGHDSENALRITFEVDAGQYPGCGIDIMSAEQWAATDGLSFFWRGDQPGLNISLTLAVEDPTQTNPDAGGYTPFGADLQSSGSEWTAVTLPWSAFVKAGWVGESGMAILDPARVAVLTIEVWESQNGSVWIDDLQLAGLTDSTAPQPPPPVTGGPQPTDKFGLWLNGPHLRGANIWQKVVRPEVDGTEAIGPGPVGPPFTQADFDGMAALGANYVNISHPGLFTEDPPYVLDEGVQANLDGLLAMIAQADMFAVISFRTGPGRSEFTFISDEAGTWFGPELLNDSVWEDQAAQDGWAAMWRYTAERYQDNPIVAGYDLMVEPNAGEVFFEIWEPEEFYPQQAGTSYDWNQLAARITTAIREVDAETPILIGGMGYSGVAWLPYIQQTGDPYTVYAVHQYAPGMYTHQYPPVANSYPGTFDTDWDGVPDQVDRAWLDAFLAPIDDYMAGYGVPVVVNEFGVVRWVPGGAQFMNDIMGLFEERGINYALWATHTSWPGFQDNDAFAFIHGPDPDNHTDVASSDQIEVIRAYWSRNTVRPSNMGQ